MLKYLGKRGISSVLIEGGGRTLGEGFDKRLIDEIRFYIAPIVQGGSVPAVAGQCRSVDNPIRLTKVIYTRIGSDLVISANVVKRDRENRSLRIKKKP